MSKSGKNIGDYIIPALLILAGLAIVFSATVGRQNGFWLLGGGLILIVGLFAVLLKLEVLSNAVQKVMFFVFIPLVLLILVTDLFRHQLSSIK
jgi:predicted membrane channel-forming protein YqfA (hemolysin III family)